MCNRATPRFNREGDSFSSKIKWPIGRPAPKGAMAQAVPGYDFDDWASIPPCSARSMPHDITDDYGDEQRSPTRDDVYGDDDDGVYDEHEYNAAADAAYAQDGRYEEAEYAEEPFDHHYAGSEGSYGYPPDDAYLSEQHEGGEEEEGEDLESSMAWALGSATSLTMPPPAFAPPPNETDADQCGACDDDDEQELQEHGDDVYDDDIDGGEPSTRSVISFAEYSSRYGGTSSRSELESESAREERRMYNAMLEREEAEAKAAAKRAAAETRALLGETAERQKQQASERHAAAAPPDDSLHRAETTTTAATANAKQHRRSAEEIVADEENEDNEAGEDDAAPPPAQWPEFDEEEARGGPVDMSECGVCGRHFACDRLARHQKACTKMKTRGEKRKAFDVRGQRWQATDAEQYVKTAAKRGQLERPDPESQASAREAKRKKWLAQSRAIRRAARAGKGGSARDADPFPVEEEEEVDDRVQCPNCGRKFAALPAERHIARCKDIRAKPTTLKRSQKAAAPMMKKAAAPAPPPAPAAGGAKEPPAPSSVAGGGASDRSVTSDRSAGGRPNVPTLNLKAIRRAPTMRPAVAAPPPPPPPPAEEEAAVHEAEHGMSEAPQEEPPPPPPSEIDQLHALGDAKFGRGRTAGRRPPAAPNSRPPAAENEKQQRQQQQQQQPARRQSSGYGKINPLARKPSPTPADKAAATGQASPKDGSPAPSPKSSASRTGTPTAKRKSFANVASSGYGQARRSSSPVPTGGGDADASGRSARSSTGGSSARASPKTGGGGGSERSAGSARSSARSAGGLSNSGRKVAQCSPGMRPPTAKKTPGGTTPAAHRPSPGAKPAVARRPMAPKSSSSANAMAQASPRGPAGARPRAADKPAREAKMKEEMDRREAKASAAAHKAAAGAEPEAPALEVLPFFKVSTADVGAAAAAVGDAPPPVVVSDEVSAAPARRLSQLKSPSAKSPNALRSSSFGVIHRQASLEDIARTCASPTPYAGAPLSASHALWDAMPGLASAERVLADAKTPNAAAAPPRMNSPLFDRPPSGSAVKPARRGSLLQRFSGDTKENQIPDYCEVKVERFGWRRGSFVSRQNSPLLTR